MSITAAQPAIFAMFDMVSGSALAFWRTAALVIAQFLPKILVACLSNWRVIAATISSPYAASEVLHNNLALGATSFACAGKCPIREAANKGISSFFIGSFVDMGRGASQALYQMPMILNDTWYFWDFPDTSVLALTP